MRRPDERLDGRDGGARARVPPGQWLDVRFEDVLADPPACFRELLAFAGLEAVPAFERQLARIEFRRDRRQAFRRTLDAATGAALEGSLAEHLRAWGYDDLGEAAG
jgi:hypothetical protein